MVYIIVLNWKGAADTIACVDSLCHLEGAEYRIVVCDNASPDGSYQRIRQAIAEHSTLGAMPCLELDRNSAEAYIPAAGDKKIYLIQTGANLGYAGGNNVGIRMALNDPAMRYVWVLNNDTLVAKDSLALMVKRCEANPKIGICGSRLIYADTPDKLQGLGGCYNRWLCTTRHFAAMAPADAVFDDDEVEQQIDYVIGASMLLTRKLLDVVGLMGEEYFLYYEELDLALRAKNAGFNNGVCSGSHVWHKEGASTQAGRSDLADYYSIRNRLVLTNKFSPRCVYTVWLSLWGVMFNRLRRGELKKVLVCFRLIMCRR